MKEINTYEDFLNLTAKEFHEFCRVKQPRDIVQKVFSFYKRAKTEGKLENIINEENYDGILLKDIFGVKINE